MSQRQDSGNWMDRIRGFFVRPGDTAPAGGEGEVPAAERRRLRIGIDVGGTFTHAVALDVATQEVVERIKVPTSHDAPEGVAAGIVRALQDLLARPALQGSEISLIAHSTTQATNALLEGDVAPVGIIGMGGGVEAGMARRATRIGDIPLAGGHSLKTYHRFLDTSRGLPDDAIGEAIRALKALGAQAFVFSAAFAVDDAAHEARGVEIARAMGLHACAGHEISQLYGLRARTRTAVINASMLPRMVETANLTEDSVKAAGIVAPLMVMRSDGGVMAIDEMRRRPILTMLSGPAAGVAAAMMHVRLSDGIFLEVGGTSTDVSVIRNGKALVRSAELGGNRLYLQTLDVRTLGVAGGSLPRVRDGRILAVGPRSAHISGLRYAAFPGTQEPHFEPTIVAPRPGDPSDYLALRTVEGITHALTTSCAANHAGMVPTGDPAHGHAGSIQAALVATGRMLGKAPDDLAAAILDRATQPCQELVERLLVEYRLERSQITLVGGGGGAAAIVPWLARRMGMRFVLADNADVISAIGVALALVRETIERSMVAPSTDDLLRLRREAETAVARLGAAQGTIEVQLEIDAQRNIVRAIATGATELRTRADQAGERPAADLLQVAARSLGRTPDHVSEVSRTEAYHLYAASWEERTLLGLLRRPRQGLRVVDQDGVVRLQANRGAWLATTVSEAPGALRAFLEGHAHYGDGGKDIPDCFVLAGRKILDLSGLLSADQVVSLCVPDLEGMPGDAPVVVVGALRR